MKYVLYLTAALLFLSFPAYAQSEMMRDEDLQKDFDNCMGGEKAADQPERAHFCTCVRDGMKYWTVDDYGNQAMEAKETQKAPEKLAELSKRCLSESLH